MQDRAKMYVVTHKEILLFVACVCVHVCVYVCACMHVCACMCLLCVIPYQLAMTWQVFLYLFFSCQSCAAGNAVYTSTKDHLGG